MRELPAQPEAEQLGRVHGRARERGPGLAERRLAAAPPQARVDVQRAAREAVVELRHEGERAALRLRDLLRGLLVDDVPIRHLERWREAQVDLVLARPPFALAELDGHGGG